MLYDRLSGDGDFSGDLNSAFGPRRRIRAFPMPNQGFGVASPGGMRPGGDRIDVILGQMPPAMREALMQQISSMPGDPEAKIARLAEVLNQPEMQERLAPALSSHLPNEAGQMPGKKRRRPGGPQTPTTSAAAAPPPPPPPQTSNIGSTTPPPTVATPINDFDFAPFANQANYHEDPAFQQAWQDTFQAVGRLSPEQREQFDAIMASHTGANAITPGGGAGIKAMRDAYNAVVGGVTNEDPGSQTSFAATTPGSNASKTTPAPATSSFTGLPQNQPQHFGGSTTSGTPAAPAPKPKPPVSSGPAAGAAGGGAGAGAGAGYGNPEAMRRRRMRDREQSQTGSAPSATATGVPNPRPRPKRPGYTGGFGGSSSR